MIRVFSYISAILVPENCISGSRYAETNPFSGLPLKDNRQAHTLKDRYSLNELQILFDPTIFSVANMRSSFKYWVPLLCLYTGGRLAEIVQLRTQDVFGGDISYISIVPGADYRATKSNPGKLKTSSSERIVPLHPALTDLGFLEHVESVRRWKKERLFDNAFGTKNGPVDRVGKWFRHYRRRLKIGELKTGDGRKKLDMHSFRHTFSDSLKQKLVDDRVIRQLCGQKQESISAGRYSKDFDLERLYNAVCQIDYGLNLPL